LYSILLDGHLQSAIGGDFGLSEGNFGHRRVGGEVAAFGLRNRRDKPRSAGSLMR
jgi:hypothetical protein